ncbi:disease resistance protein RUN1-like [Bidens hawaiensis]|uniref:disease resistance protein RUN1-like n=1 Tax=Bidens hawaiensis TaxID=980011 RepID=UPI00404949E2
MSLQIYDISLYASHIKNALARKRVLRVLDDIDSLDQLDALLGHKGLHHGSKVIITTKDASLTECGLYESESLEPTEGYKEVSKKLKKYCDGHPPALEVLGRCVTEIILNACDINTRSGITNLTDKCLLTIGRNELKMHQLVQEMGRDLVRQESPEKHGSVVDYGVMRSHSKC